MCRFVGTSPPDEEQTETDRVYLRDVPVVYLNGNFSPPMENHMASVCELSVCVNATVFRCRAIFNLECIIRSVFR